MRYSIGLDTLDAVLTIGYFAQFILAVLVAYIFNLYFNTFKINFLRDWSIAWIFYALAMVSYPIIIVVFNWKTSSSPVGLLASLSALLFSYCHIFAMLTGLFMMDSGKNVLTRNLKIVGYLGIFIFSLVGVLLYSQSPPDYKLRLFLRIGLKDAITSVAYLFVAAKLIRRKTPGVGFKPRNTNKRYLTCFSAHPPYQMAQVLAYTLLKKQYPNCVGKLQLRLNWGRGVCSALVYPKARWVWQYTLLPTKLCSKPLES